MGLGNVVTRLYILLAFGLEIENAGGVMGPLPKRKGAKEWPEASKRVDREWDQSPVIAVFVAYYSVAENLGPCVGAEILGDPYTKKSPLPRIGDPSSRLPVAPNIPSHRILGQSRILNRITLPHTIPRSAPIE